MKRGSWGGVFNVIYSFHMPLFMFISGFLFFQAYYDKSKAAYSGERIKRQSLNLAGVYVLFSIVLGIFKMVFSGNVNNAVTIKDILMIWCRAIAPYWYLYDLIVFYFLFSRKAVYTRKDDLLLLLTVAVSLCSIVVRSRLFEARNLLYYALFFYLGILYCKNRMHPLFSLPAVLTLFALSCVCFAVFWGDSRTLNNIALVNCVTALGFSLVLVQLFEKVGMLANNAVFRLVGKNCLEVYVTHCFLTAGFRAVFPKIGIHHIVVSVLLNAVLSTVIPLAAAAAVRSLGVHDIFFKPYTYVAGHISDRKTCGDQK